MRNVLTLTVVKARQAGRCSFGGPGVRQPGGNRIYGKRRTQRLTLCGWEDRWIPGVDQRAMGEEWLSSGCFCVLPFLGMQPPVCKHTHPHVHTRAQTVCAHAHAREGICSDFLSALSFPQFGP